jgi:hypothetical protein
LSHQQRVEVELCEEGEGEHWWGLLICMGKIFIYSQIYPVKSSQGNRGKLNLCFEKKEVKSQSSENRGKITIPFQSKGKNSKAPKFYVMSSILST